jgi:transcriptional regulator with XRE-family HTH domain
MPKKRLYDTEFGVRLKMALHHLKQDWTSPTKAGEFLGKSRQTVHQWFNGTIPDTNELWKLEDKLKVSARWLVTGDNEPEWFKYVKKDPFLDIPSPANDSNANLLPSSPREPVKRKKAKRPK